MVIVKVLVFAMGATLVLITLRSAFRTLVVPRALLSYLSRFVFVWLRRVFWLRANHRHSYERRDRVMAFYAPLSLFTLLGVWLTLVLAGYTAMFWAVGHGSVRGAFTESGSSLLTLGFAQELGLATVILAFTEATLGLTLLALLITYLPSLYQGFQRREAGVSKLEVRGGKPPSGTYLIELSWIVGHMGNLTDLWSSWEDWFVDVDETHTSYPALGFFRSPHPDESWITAAGAVLDAASLYVAAVDVESPPEPEFMIRAGYLCLRHIAEFFRIPFDADPSPDDAISITREEFDAACDHMAAAGVPIVADRDLAWRDFAGWRVNYDAPLFGLARLVMAPYAPWSSDRYPDGHYVPPAFPGLRRKRDRT
jgi:hypothetical protein